MTIPRSEYEARILRVIEHLHQVKGAPDLDDLAEIACFSRFHFHRVFRAMTGQTVAQAVRMVRMWRGSKVLSGGGSIEAAAKAADYADVPSFSRAFRAAHGVSPGAFKSALTRPGKGLIREENTMTTYPVDIRDIPAERVIGIPHQGAYTEIAVSFEKLFTVLTSRGLFEKAKVMTALYYDDPSATSEDALRSLAAVAVPEDVTLPDGCAQDVAVGGKHAVLTFTGHYSGLHEAYEWLYGTWLPSSGFEPAHAAIQEVYLNSPRDVQPHELVTEIHIPLAA
ncbi:MAG: AraC family transcriptional regulator [Pseudomonadota bacterium]